MSLLLVVAGAAASNLLVCPLPFEVVRDEASAREIAKVVIASAPAKTVHKHIKRYDLRVSFVQERRSWIVYEAAAPVDGGVGILGGGGLGMEIAACDGSVSDIHRQR